MHDSPKWFPVSQAIHLADFRLQMGRHAPIHKPGGSGPSFPHVIQCRIVSSLILASCLPAPKPLAFGILALFAVRHWDISCRWKNYDPGSFPNATEFLQGTFPIKTKSSKSFRNSQLPIISNIFDFQFFPALQLQILGVDLGSTRRQPAEPWPSTSYQLLWEVWFGTAVFFSAQLCEQETSKNMFIPYISASMCCIQSKGKAPCQLALILVWRSKMASSCAYLVAAGNSSEVLRRCHQKLSRHPLACYTHWSSLHSSPRTCKDVELWNDMTC